VLTSTAQSNSPPVLSGDDLTQWVTRERLLKQKGSSVPCSWSTHHCMLTDEHLEWLDPKTCKSKGSKLLLALASCAALWPVVGSSTCGRWWGAAPTAGCIGHGARRVGGGLLAVRVGLARTSPTSTRTHNYTCTAPRATHRPTRTLCAAAPGLMEPMRRTGSCREDRSVTGRPLSTIRATGLWAGRLVEEARAKGSAVLHAVATGPHTQLRGVEL
jgi:hypothetical protein